jgi:hypothetical protein
MYIAYFFLSEKLSMNRAEFLIECGRKVFPGPGNKDKEFDL